MAYKPGDLMAIGGGSQGPYRVVENASLSEVMHGQRWDDVVGEWLKLVWPGGVEIVNTWGRSDRALFGRLLGGVHLFLLGYVDGDRLPGVASVESESLEYVRYRVTWREGGSPGCECMDYVRSFAERWYREVPKLNGYIVCKHIVALLLWLRYKEEKGGTSDGMVADRSEHKGNAEAA